MYIFISAYSAWKENLEDNESVSFFSENTKILQNGNKKTYLRCHRSGFYSSSASHRIPKSKTCKIGRHCPATIEITETDACVTVIHYKTHVGHDLDLKYQKIGKTDKEIIKSMFIFSILVFASYMLSFISFYPVNLNLS